MANEPPGKRFRFSLRTLFAFTLAVGVGMTVGGPWFDVALAALSTGLVIGLLQEALHVRKWAQVDGPTAPGLRAAAVAAVMWRLVVAGLLAMNLVARIVLNRFGVQLPQGEIWHHADLATAFAWWLCVVIGLIASVAAASPRRVVKQHRWIDVLAAVGAVVILLHSTIDKMMILFLVHIACSGVDAGLVHTGGRYGLTTPAEQADFAAYGAAAMAACLAAAGLLIDVLRENRRRTVRVIEAVIGFVLLFGAMAYCYWYYAVGFPMASPDLAVVTLGASWYLRVAGILVAAILVTAGAYRLARRWQPECAASILRDGVIHESPLFVALAFGVAATPVYDTVRMFFDESMLASGVSAAEVIAYLLTDPCAQLQAAIAIISMQFVWQSWRRRGTPKVLWIVPWDGQKFAVAWAILALLLAVAVPTISAFAFSFWLGPWYLW